MVIYDLSPPYPVGGFSLQVLRAEPAMEGRRLVLATPNKRRQEERVGPTEAIELTGTRQDLSAVVAAVRRALATP